MLFLVTVTCLCVMMPFVFYDNGSDMAELRPMPAPAVINGGHAATGMLSNQTTPATRTTTSLSITEIFKGRLGTELFQYAALCGIAALNNMTATIPASLSLRKAFPNLHVTVTKTPPLFQLFHLCRHPCPKRRCVKESSARQGLRHPQQRISQPSHGIC